MLTMQHKNLSEQAKQVASIHNSKTAKRNYTQTIIDELKPVLDKIFSIPSGNITKHIFLCVHSPECKINAKDMYNIAFDLKKYHIQFLFDEGFHVTYDPIDECYLILW